jgi:hypothetical protein
LICRIHKNMGKKHTTDSTPESQKFRELKARLKKLDEPKEASSRLGGQSEEALPIQSKTCDDRDLGNKPKRSLRENFNNDAGEAVVEVATHSHLKQQIALLPASLQQDILEDISNRLGCVLVDPADLATLRAAAKRIGVPLASIQAQRNLGRIATIKLSDGREMVRISDCETLWANGPLPHGTHFKRI